MNFAGNIIDRGRQDALRSPAVAQHGAAAYDAFKQGNFGTGVRCVRFESTLKRRQFAKLQFQICRITPIVTFFMIRILLSFRYIFCSESIKAIGANIAASGGRR